VTHFPVTVICQALHMARRTAYYMARARPAGRYHRAADPTVLEQIRAVTNSRATYGYRRVWAMVNRTFRTGYNRKRIRRVMQVDELLPAPRAHRAHTQSRLGRIAGLRPRWCSDVFLWPCWRGKVVSVVFAIDFRSLGPRPRGRLCPRPVTGSGYSHADGSRALLKVSQAMQWSQTTGPLGLSTRPTTAVL
jgi:hypothetical protein